MTTGNKPILAVEFTSKMQRQTPRLLARCAAARHSRPMPLQQTPSPASAWIDSHSHLAPSRGRVLDLACGNGRHSRLFLHLGHGVTAVDRDLDGVADLADQPQVTLLEADLENAPWPLAGQQFDTVIVCNYLHRPLLPAIARAVAPGGLLLYDTFARGNERFGRPRNPDFLLRANELLQWASPDFIIRAYQHGPVDTPRPAMRQRLCALRAPASF